MKTNNIKNLPIRNKDVDYAALEKLKAYNKKLEEELKETKKLIETAVNQTDSTSTRQRSTDLSDFLSFTY